MQLIVLIPLIGWLVLIYFYTQAGKSPNRFASSTASEG
jgi:hypothetical protein